VGFPPMIKTRSRYFTFNFNDQATPRIQSLINLGKDPTARRIISRKTGAIEIPAIPIVRGIEN
jgi:hypothetical protein